MIPHREKTPRAAAPAAVAANREGPVQEVYGLLQQAADAAAKAGLPPEAFTAAAWQAYLAASPELAERLADLQFEAALEELRKSGRMAKA